MLLKDFSGNPFPAVGEERDREAGFGPWREHRTAQSVGHLRRDTNGRKQAQDNGDWGLSRELSLATSTKRVSFFDQRYSYSSTSGRMEFLDFSE
ncbi:hypothetical protein HZH68_002203 [Vespula germanica]|uniref:Uncharacterized protein n=1 Tax=Vespula germanica TaxID=30212 RepID=A0A834KYZ7_VESGE|nr:hypothetical protein HZH68_002203 [Vespula germanica]